MTSFRQIEANRRNALRSTGPKAEEGKKRSRRNALRHGFSAETVVETVEDIDDYKGFEAAIIADYDARTAVERELVLRLASVLWRLRRATAIETDLLRAQAEILRRRKDDGLRLRRQFLPEPFLALTNRLTKEHDRNYARGGEVIGDFDPYNSRPAPSPIGSIRELTSSFQQLASHDSLVFERLGRHETALMRQVVKILFLIKSARVL
jgi:hypothetical protein